MLRLEGDNPVDEDFGEIFGLGIWESPKLPANVSIQQVRFKMIKYPTPIENIHGINIQIRRMTPTSSLLHAARLVDSPRLVRYKYLDVEPMHIFSQTFTHKKSNSFSPAATTVRTTRSYYRRC